MLRRHLLRPPHPCSFPARLRQRCCHRRLRLFRSISGKENKTHFHLFPHSPLARFSLPTQRVLSKKEVRKRRQRSADRKVIHTIRIPSFFLRTFCFLLLQLCCMDAILCKKLAVRRIDVLCHFPPPCPPTVSQGLQPNLCLLSPLVPRLLLLCRRQVVLWIRPSKRAECKLSSCMQSMKMLNQRQKDKFTACHSR